MTNTRIARVLRFATFIVAGITLGVTVGLIFGQDLFWPACAGCWAGMLLD